MKKNLIIVAITLVLGAVGILFMSAPSLTTVNTTVEATAETTTEANLPQFPSVTSTNLDGTELTFPQDFSADYNLIVMPFDRDQQALAIEWLPLFQELSATDERLNYYSIAALEDLSSPIRTLVMGGLNFGVSEPALRERVIVLFLPDQQGFIEALGFNTMNSMQVLIVNQQGQVVFSLAGAYSDTLAQALREAVQTLE
jgi:hypothetical protein